jgi:hypothetical protein
MKNAFHDYFFGLPVPERVMLAKRIGTSVPFLESVAGGFKSPSLRMATRIIDAAGGKTKVSLSSYGMEFVVSKSSYGFKAVSDGSVA